eukprot:TRINITY_DN14598_c0_g1_i4.p1 TRINITY_DN14598_c0_g1~~TRINITY_DN14598_c0_g1_i4.p1  ORF type:complete len:940 (-),score=205.34 TRINITY_DN14598_c0_g1_i4:292-3111(-)
MEVIAGMHIAGAAAASGAVGGTAAKTAFSYNRENFLWDRQMRLRKEFKVQKFRVEQAELWRKDVRDLISLTEYKMHVYLLVNVLLLGFSVTLWCQGKLPNTTPNWLMMGSALSICCSFMFILLSVWMAMHAAVAAQGFETRLLTQMVRLPIPTWTEIEACRTNASDFERTESSQMFRIPFAMGKQEGLVPEVSEEDNGDDEELLSMPMSPHHGSAASEASSPPHQRAGQKHSRKDFVDPWGLERSGCNLPELGCKKGASMVNARHVKLTRRAMTFWQSYDAYARISMSIGVNQLLLALVYFILAYYLEEVRVRSAATYGVVMCTALAETLSRLDMSLGWWQSRMLQLFIFLGPAMATTAGYFYMEEGREREAEALVVLAFLAHGLYLVAMNTLCRVQQEHNGTWLPVAFRSVLYLDVFGWTRKQEEEFTGSPSPCYTDDGHALSEATVEDMVYQRQSRQEVGPRKRPTARTVAYDSDGRPKSWRPEDLASGETDFQHVAGAPNPNTTRNVDECRYGNFFQAGGWLQPKEEYATLKDSSVVTGHEHEAPLMLPWKTFSFVMNLACAAWLGAAFYHALDAAHIWGASPVALFHIAPAHQSLAQVDLPNIMLARKANVHKSRSWLVNLIDDIEIGNHDEVERLQEKQKLTVDWPNPNVVPHGLACDASGSRFMVSDGVTMFTAELKQEIQNVNQGNGTQPTPVVEFDEFDCDEVAGQALQDVALTCPSGKGCEALVLHKHGKRLAACPMGNAPANYKADVADSWLEEFRTRSSSADLSVSAGVDKPHARIEKAVTLAADSGCSADATDNIWGGCILIGTTRGRVVRLAAKEGRSGGLHPTQALRERSEVDGIEPWKPGQVRSIGPDHFGVLLAGGDHIQIIEKAGGQEAGTLEIRADKKTKTAAGFCAGGGYIYVLDRGASPGIWRMPIPKNLMATPPAAEL